MADTLFKLDAPIRTATIQEFRAAAGGRYPTKGADLREFGFAWGTYDERPEVPADKVLVPDEPQLNGTFVTVGWAVRDKTAQGLADELAAMREGLVVTRTQFASACFIAGIIGGQEAIDWASGNALPSNVEAAIVAAIPDPVQQIVALTKAGSETHVRRNNLLIELLAASPSFDMNETEVDQLFALAAWVD